MKNLVNDLIEISKASSTDEYRAHISSVCIDERDGKLRMRATNGHLLAERFVDMPKELSGIAEFIIPIEDIKAIGKMAKGVNEITSKLIDAPKRAIEFGFGKSSYRAEAFVGTYPDTDAVKPKEREEMQITFGHEKLMQLAEALGSDDKRNSSVTFHISKTDSIAAIRVECAGNFGLLMPMRRN